MRWKISYNPHADGTDRGIPRDAGELYACRITVALKAAPNFSGRLSSVYRLKIAVLSTTRKIISKSVSKIVSKIISKLLINSIEFGIIKNRISARNG